MCGCNEAAKEKLAEDYLSPLRVGEVTALFSKVKRLVSKLRSNDPNVRGDFHWELLPFMKVHYPLLYSFYARYELIRVSRLLTYLLGFRYSRSRSLIEIDITYACNLRCNDCNRSVAQAPSNQRLSLQQIRRFLEESKAKNYKWDRFRILGGEPTLHPEFEGIIQLLVSYKHDVAPEIEIIVVSNGYGDAVEKALKRIPSDIKIQNTSKKGDPEIDAREGDFALFNLAPLDLKAHRSSDFRNGCFITEICGMALTPYGFYPCAVAGGIDRIIGVNSGRKSIPSKSDDMRDQLSEFCSLCGHFALYNGREPGDKLRVSKTWQKKYAEWRSRRPKLDRYGDPDNRS